jgi:hypothetical protein
LGGKRQAVQHLDTLHTLAEVAAAFAGFTGIVVVLGRGSIAEWRSVDKATVSLLLASSLGVVFFGFLPEVAVAAHLSPSSAWRVSAFLFASYQLVVFLSAIRTHRRGLALGEISRIQHLSRLPAILGGPLVIGAMFVSAAGLLEPWLFLSYLLGMLWLLGMATLMFAILLLEAASSKPGA